MYKAPALGLFLLACHILACITVGILFRNYKKGKSLKRHTNSGYVFRRFKSELNVSNEGRSINIGTVFEDAVKNSLSLILAIGGFIILFSVIINILLETGLIGHLSALTWYAIGIDINTINAVISGFFEITTGTNLVSSIKGIPIQQQLAATSLIIGWAGLSVHSQVLSIVGSTDIILKTISSWKVACKALSPPSAGLGCNFFAGRLIPKQVFASLHTPQSANWQGSFATSFMYLIYVLAAYALLCFGIIVVNRIKKRVL